MNKGASATQTGPSQAEPEGVSALRASVPCADTLVRMGRAADDALMSEQGVYDAGLAAWLALQAAELAAMPDDSIDTSDIPEVIDWSGAEIGRFTAQAIEARRAATLGAVHESAVGSADASTQQPGAIK